MKPSTKLLNKILTTQTINQNVIKTEYAVRGKVVQVAEQVRAALAEKKSLPFNELVFCNIGNPQQLQQKPITFFRNVLSCVINPDLIDKKELTTLFKPDVFRRAKTILAGIDGNSGAYTHSQGLMSVRKNVAKFIEERDGIQGVNPDYLFLTDGASVGVRLGLKALIRGPNDGIMVPIPQYPLYSAGIQLYGGAQVDYFLNEEDGWGLSVAELERSFATAKKKGVDVRALVIINPGNPTGQVLRKENMKDIVDFCVKNRVVLLADEVYQENIYGSKPFYSFSKVVDEMGLTDSFEMISYHSISKGFLGECGRRGGYFQLSKGFDKDVKEQLYKVSSINLCPNVDGQVILDMKVRPPVSGEESFEEYNKEKNDILDSLKRRANTLVSTLNTLEGVSCNQAEGAMYAFPKITIPQKAVAEARAQGIAPDLLYSLELLKGTGIVVVPGSGFGQVDGTYHFRTTFLPPEDKIAAVSEKLKKFHEDFLNKFK